MARNKLIDLNNHLFEALERINDENLKGESLQEEIARAKTILALEAEKYKNEFGRGASLPLMIENAK